MPQTSVKVILTGVTGMVGEGVLHECLLHPQVSQVLVITRKPSGMSHPKLRELLHADFFDLSPIRSQLAGYDACLFCVGITSIGLSKEEYFKLTYTLTLSVAKTLSDINPAMTFCYTSAAGTGRNSKSHWARTKAKAEDDLIALPFAGVYCFRPGFIRPTKGLKQTHGFYRYINWLFPLGRMISRKWFCTMAELGRAMIKVSLVGYSKPVLEGADIIIMSQ